MMRMRRLWMGVLLAACGASTLLAQAGLDWMTGRTWRMRDGLPDQVVQAIAQTPDHYLWLGTKLGLVRFDGANFLDYGAGIAPALHDFGVDCIVVGKDSTLWLGTQGGGVVHLMGDQGKTYTSAEGLENGLVRALYEDDGGRIWAGTDHGLFRMDPRRKETRFTRITDKGPNADWGVHAIIGDGAGGVWAGGSRLVHFLHDAVAGIDSDMEEQLPPQSASLRIWSMALAKDRTLWITSIGGLFRKAFDQPVVRDTRVAGGTLALLIDSQSRMWVGTLGDGLLLFNADGKVSSALAGNAPENNAVLAIAEDMSHDLWVGTQSGLARISLTGMHLTRIPGAVDADFGSVAVDSDHSLWVCSRKLIHMKDGTPRPVALPGLPDVAVRSVMRDRTGAFWVGTAGSGIYRVELGGRTVHYTSEIGTNYIRGFLETAGDGVWIASDGGVANWRDGRVTSFQNAAGSPHAPVIAMASGGEQELWVGTYLGLSLLRRGVYVPTPAAEAIGRHTVWSLHRSEDGTLWIGAENGAFLYRNGRLSALRLTEELGGSAVLSILEDDRGRMWLGGRTAVLRASRATLEALAEQRLAHAAFAPEIFAVSRETGTELSGGSGSVAHLDGEGGAWFASHDGPLHIFGLETVAMRTPPPVTLRQVSIDGQHTSSTGTIVLQPSAKTIEIDVAPISLSGRPGLQLRRRLIGFDADWLPASSQPVTYTNLPPGRYVYRVEARWRGSSATTMTELTIVQKTHFYRQPLFLAACVLCVLGVLVGVYALHLHRIRLRFRVTVEERNRMAREIHDTVVQGCIGVSSMLEAIAIREEQGSREKRPDGLLTTAREQIALTIVEARDAIWDLRQPHNKGGLAHTLRALLDRMTAGRGTALFFECKGEAAPLDRMVEHELLMSVREALHNAMTHAVPSEISVVLSYEPDRLTIAIRDNGRGFEPGDAQPAGGMHFGLLGMQERMERIGGSCTINSIPGQGAEVLLEAQVRKMSWSSRDA